MIHHDYQYGQLSYSELWESFILVLNELKQHNIANHNKTQLLYECQNKCNQLEKYIKEKESNIVNLNSKINELNLKNNRKLSLKERLSGKLNT